MTMKTRAVAIALGLVGAVGVTGTANAQSFEPSGIKPPPNLIVGVDESVTMAIPYKIPVAGSCGGSCHQGAWGTTGWGAGGPPNINTYPNAGGYSALPGGLTPGGATSRLADIKRYFIGSGGLGATGTDGVMGMFKDKFLFGSFAFSGARFAHVKDLGFNNPLGYPGAGYTTLPNAGAVQASFDATRQQIWSTAPDWCFTTKGSVGCAEAMLPGGLLSQCIVPFDNAPCPNDDDVLESLLRDIPAGSRPAGLSGTFLTALQPVGNATVCSSWVDTPSLGPPFGLGAASDGQADQCGNGRPETWPIAENCSTGGSATPKDGNRCTPCSNPAGPGGAYGSIDPMWEVIHQVVAWAGYTGFTRFSVANTPTPGEVDNALCSPLNGGVLQVRKRLYDCLHNPQAYLNMGPCDNPPSPDCGYQDSGRTASLANISGWGVYTCDYTTLSTTLCAGTSALVGTCVCDQYQLGCGGGSVLDMCGKSVSISGRLQLALCYAHDDAAADGGGPSPIYTSLSGQADNIINGGCRSNALALLTDGWHRTISLGNATSGIAGQAAAISNLYKASMAPFTPASTFPQAYIFKAGQTGPNSDGTWGGGGFRTVSPYAGSFDNAADGVQAVMTTVPGILAREGYYDTGDGANADGRKEMVSALVSVLNRQRFGLFSAANLGFDRFETRVAILTYTVPGASSAAGSFDANITQYAGRPARISWHAVDSTGAIAGTPIFETDWTSLAGVGANCYITGGDPDTCTPAWLNPAGFWRGSINAVLPGAEVAKTITVPGTASDRNGNGITNEGVGVDTPVVTGAAPANIASGGSYTWGHMLGAQSSQPVVVEAPREPATGAKATSFAYYQNKAPIPSQRPRMIYTMSNGYLHAIKAGDYSVAAAPPPLFGGRMVFPFGYSETAANGTGRELWRYKPSFIRSTWMPQAKQNAFMHTEVMNGQIVVREIETFGSGVAGCAYAFDATLPSCMYRTVLVMNQGLAGPGYAAIDVTNPASPILLWDRPLLEAANVTGWPAAAPPLAPVLGAVSKYPGAVSEPIIYKWPGDKDGAPRPRPAIVVTGGVGGQRKLYAYNLMTGALIASVNLANGGAGPEFDYRAVTCIDTNGDGISYCYVLRGDGAISRVKVTALSMTVVTNDAAPHTGNGYVLGANEFWTRPVAFFDAESKVNLVWGSGDITQLNVAAAGNAVWRARDVGFTGALNVEVGANNPCKNGAPGKFPVPGLITAPPVVGKGIIAFTSYSPVAGGCTMGTSDLFAIRVDNCNAADTNAAYSPAAPISGGKTGVALSPALLRNSDTLVHHTSRDAKASDAAQTAQLASSSGGIGRKITRPLYFRLQSALK